MLDAWIIEQIEEQRREREREQPCVYIDPPPEYNPEQSPKSEEPSERGVIIIEMG